ncbi:hypothetical protein GCM10023350_13570 [Nocardioides endophyticus]|uniref:Uncharacterized protein n=1 Tax=Nocardioides endophyticus TaxID=1353775 RepID=A0ABP8YLI2_9ACTN
MLIRAAYVAPLVYALRRRADRSLASRDRLATMQTQLDDGTLPVRSRPQRQPRNEHEAERLEQHIEHRTRMFGTRIRRTLADVDYLAGGPLGWREGTVLVGAGMRGVVTLASRAAPCRCWCPGWAWRPRPTTTRIPSCAPDDQSQ